MDNNQNRVYKTMVEMVRKDPTLYPWRIVNENDPRLQSTLSLLPFLAYDSASRKQMYSSHIGSRLTLLHGTERMITSGTDIDFGRYVFDVKAPCDLTVVSSFELYPRDAIHGKRRNPCRIVIYRENESLRYGMLELAPYGMHHSHFGYPMTETAAARLLTPGNTIPEGTVLSSPPSVGANGEYKFSIGLMTAYMSLPATAEDGVVISESACRRLASTRLETRTISWGNGKIPLPIYNNKKIFPDLGEVVRGDGLLMALRPMANDMIVANQSTAALSEVDYNSDELVYVLPNNQTIDERDEKTRITGHGRVVDIRIYYNGNPANVPMSEYIPELDQQPMEYERYRREFCGKVMDSYSRLKRQNNTAKLPMTDQLDALVTDCLVSMYHEPRWRPVKGEGGAKEEIRRLRRKSAMDLWEVTITVEYTIIPTIGFKLTDLHGGKGVICKIVPDDEMPINEMGVRAEVVMDPAGRMNRMIPGSLYEHYIASCCVQVRQDLGGKLGERIYPEVILDEHGGSPKARRAVMLEQLVRTAEPSTIEAMWVYLMSLYQLFAPIQYDNYLDLPFEAKVDILVGAVTENIQLLMPTNNPIWVPAAMLHAEARFAPEYGPVEYRGNSTRLSTTVRSVRIAPVEYILLDKTADSGSAVSSGRQQIHGVLTQTTSNEKYSSPVRNNSTRLTGETEMRIIASTTEPETAPELLDRNANPLVHEVITEGIMTHSTPSNVESLIDRRRYPLGFSRPLQIVRHIARCAGWSFRASKYRDLAPKPRDFE